MAHKKKRPIRRRTRPIRPFPNGFDQNDEMDLTSSSIEWPIPDLQNEEDVSDDDLMRVVLRHHPELERLMRKTELPDELIDENGNAWSPRSHLQMHVTIELQLATDKPTGIRAVTERVQQAKRLAPHDIRHVLGAALAEQIWYLMKEQRGFDEAQYFRDIERSYLEWLAEIER